MVSYKHSYQSQQILRMGSRILINTWVVAHSYSQEFFMHHHTKYGGHKVPIFNSAIKKILNGKTKFFYKKIFFFIFILIKMYLSSLFQTIQSEVINKPA